MCCLLREERLCERVEWNLVREKSDEQPAVEGFEGIQIVLTLALSRRETRQIFLFSFNPRRCVHVARKPQGPFGFVRNKKKPRVRRQNVEEINASELKLMENNLGLCLMRFPREGWKERERKNSWAYRKAGSKCKANEVFRRKRERKEKVVKFRRWWETPGRQFYRIGNLMVRK